MLLQIFARNRILFASHELKEGRLLNLAPYDERAKHLLEVLKVQPQHQVKVGIINGLLGTASVLQVQPNITLECCNWSQPAKLPELCLVLAMPRPKVMMRMWSTLACLGVSSVYITAASKVEKVYFASHSLKTDRIWQEMIIGAEQAGDTRLPAVYLSKSLKATLAAVQASLDDQSQATAAQTSVDAQVQAVAAQASLSDQSQATAMQTSVDNQSQAAAAQASLGDQSQATAMRTSADNQSQAAAAQASLGDQSQAAALRRVQCLVPKHATDLSAAVQNGRVRSAPATDLIPAVKNGILGSAPATELRPADDSRTVGSAPPQDNSTGAASSSMVDVRNTVVGSAPSTDFTPAVQDGKMRPAPDRGYSTVAALSSSIAAFEGSDGRHAIKLLAHTAGGVPVHQAVSARLSRKTKQHQEIGNTTAQASTSQVDGGVSDSAAMVPMPAKVQVNDEAADVVTKSVGAEASKNMQHAEPVLVLAIGPEGGWSDAELALLTDQWGFELVTTANSRTLDTTTAVISLVSLILEAVQ